MKLSYIFMQEFKRSVAFVFLILIALSLSLIVGQILSMSISVVGIIQGSSYGIKVSGYVFDFQGNGVSSEIKLSYYNFTESVKTNNGSFYLYLPVAYVHNSTRINLIIIKNSLQKSVNLTVYIPNSSTTFAFSSLFLKYYSSQNLSIISVKGKTFIAVDPEQENLNYTISEIDSDNVNLPLNVNFTYNNFSNTLKIPLIILLIFVFSFIDLMSYYLLSSFPRGELRQIIRLVGISKVYIGKLLAEIPLIIMLSSLPFYLFEFILIGNNIVLILPYIIASISFSLGVYGLAPFGSKNMIYYSVILGFYIINLIIYDRYLDSLLATILLIVGYVKMRLS
ncbi:hypothetical protein AB1303_08480 [Saccharolobus solfataricus]|uniref:Uncharacterized protein n=1 Tax=Saccharolobus solfataricus TaxID=2287 RepID=A0A157T759_SACSO|nr:hypothetical protein [Saccharolobus solfataricus]SAI86741.1 uncharacterised protein [Saccharolobus solfataricus]